MSTHSTGTARSPTRQSSFRAMVAVHLVLLGGGVLRESGTHGELLAQRGLYFRLFELQYAAMAASDRLVAG